MGISAAKNRKAIQPRVRKELWTPAIFFTEELLLASVVIFIDARYFPFGVTEWVEDVPTIVYLLGDFHFADAQEMILVLLWGCYAGVSSTAWCMRNVWKRRIAD